VEPAVELQRLATLFETGLLDTPADPAFDDLVHLTARLLDAPVAAFNLIGADRQWTKAGVGLNAGDELPRAASFCAHAVESGTPLMVPDARADPRFAGNALGFGFYAGVPVLAGAQPIGTLCVAGPRARTVSEDELETLRVLADAVGAHVQLAWRERERHEEIVRLRRLGDATGRLATAPDATVVAEVLGECARELAGADGAVVWIALPSGALRATASLGLDAVGAELLPGNGAASRLAFDSGARIYRGQPEMVHIEGWDASLFEPLLSGERPVGALTVSWHAEPVPPSARTLALIELLAREAAVALERTVTLSELEKLTRVDALTGIGNRRAFDEQLSRELKRAEREGGSVALAMLDLDHFKAYNDAHGHPAGDRLLTALASAWQSCLRATDNLARYGGEEFALIAPGETPEHALKLVDRLRDTIPAGQTCSAGVALWERGESPERLLARADAALYAAKVAGRNRTRIATPPGSARAPSQA